MYVCRGGVSISLHIMAVTNMTQSLCHQCSIEGEMNLGMHIEAHYVNDVLFFFKGRVIILTVITQTLCILMETCEWEYFPTVKSFLSK